MSDPASIKIQSKPEELYARSLLYRALSILFRHPSLTKNLNLNKEFSSWKDAVETLSFPLKEPLVLYCEALVMELSRITHDEWTKQHESCFGHTVSGVMTNYELEYGEEHSHRQPQQLGDIAAFYLAFGIQLSEKIHERVDHIAVECEFLHYLIFKEAFALECDKQQEAQICREATRRFLLEHLGCWLPSFCLRLSKKSSGLLHASTFCAKDFSGSFFPSIQATNCGYPWNLLRIASANPARGFPMPPSSSESFVLLPNHEPIFH